MAALTLPWQKQPGRLAFWFERIGLLRPGGRGINRAKIAAKICSRLSWGETDEARIAFAASWRPRAGRTVRRVGAELEYKGKTLPAHRMSPARRTPLSQLGECRARPPARARHRDVLPKR